MKILFAWIAGCLLLASCSGKEAEAENPVPATSETENTDAVQTETVPESTSVKKAKTYVEKVREASEDKVMSLVWKLPEVQRLNEQIRSKTGGKRGIRTLIVSEPSDDQEYYAVSVAEDNGSAYATYYQIHVYPDYSLWYYDVAADEELSLEEWRKREAGEK